ncbi:hypothetical protein [Halopenitus persicus]|uniref:Uncharacterized protein n=1 Tax=Halopenitus persicus TaxID=1048396 RepID=A0A1H3GX77_9EURY|nr:hypothetical protein [Halopenitus persicus]QHS17409.1 hypothetical protein GWK26_09775 [haloarchaeon 3A1-DGR]SDY07114.1 hypothetical protein SAMN05216564_1039 [Halopenitus persicus]
MTDADADLMASLFRDTRRNALIGWVLVGLVGLVFLESLLPLDAQWLIVSATTAGVMALPAVARRDWRVMLPWELLVLAALPLAARALAPGVEIGVFATYLSLAALALLVVAELDMFTPMRVTHWFAVLLVVVATLATAALWTIARWGLDRTLGTTYLADNEALMVEFQWVTIAGIVAGLLFDLYFRRRDRALTRRLERELGDAGTTGSAAEDGRRSE